MLRRLDHGALGLSDFERGIGQAILEVECLGAEKDFLHRQVGQGLFGQRTYRAGSLATERSAEQNELRLAGRAHR